MTTYYHSGVALAKKKGKDIHVVETPTGIGDMLPVAAAGTAYPRQLRYRFADIVNVKDYGAIGDGVTDDTAAFETAAAKGRVFVPAGNYVVSRLVRGDFVTDASVSISGSTTYVRAANGLGDWGKDILHYGVISDEAKSFMEKASLQGLQMDDAGNFYLVWEAASPTEIVIEKYSNAFEYIGCSRFSTTLYVENVLIDNDVLAFCGSVDELYKFDLSNILWKGELNSEPIKVKTPVPFINDFQLFKIGEDIGVSCRSFAVGKVDDSISRELICRFSGDYSKLLGYTVLDFSQTGWSGSFTTSKTEAVRRAYPKRQCLSVSGTGFAANMGAGYYPQYDDTVGYFQQGILSFGPDGSLRVAALMNPRLLLEKLNSLGVESTVVEAEGICYRFGQLISLYALSNNTYVIFREFSESSNAVDFSECKSSLFLPDKDKISRLPIIRDTLYSPDDGGKFNNIVDVLKYLRDTKRPYLEFQFYNGMDFSFNGIPVSKNALVRVENSYGSSFRIYASGTDGYQGAFLASITADGELKYYTQNAIAATLSIRGNDASGHYGKILGTYGDYTSVIAQVEQVSGGFEQLRIGGGSSLFNAFGRIVFSTTTSRDTRETTGTPIVMIDAYGLYPSPDGTKPCGTAVHRWSLLYAATATVQTSDARCKENIAAPDDALMRAWGKVGFKVFQFKDAVEKKGGDARIHVGVIAQEVKAAFESEGLDASRYGLFCHDTWEDEYEDVTVVDQPEVTDDDGNITTPEVSHVEKRLVTAAGDRYGIRYEEALALECAYQRWRLAQIEARLS